MPDAEAALGGIQHLAVCVLDADKAGVQLAGTDIPKLRTFDKDALGDLGVFIREEGDGA